MRDLIGAIASTFNFPRAQLDGSCDTGLVLKDNVTSSEGDGISVLTGFVAGGQVSVDVGDGIINLKFTPHCQEKLPGSVVVH